MTDRSVRPWLRLAPLLVLVVSTGASVVTTAAEANAALSEQQGAATHVIVFREGVDVDAAAEGLARAHGLEVTRIYRHALRGMAAVVPEGRLKALGKDPRVAFVDLNIAYTVADQIIPTGIHRIEADKNPKADIDQTDDVRVDLDVAIIDTGINTGHPDLNAICGRNFAGGSPNNCTDGYGHGTHVAGTVGALDNGFGVVGVAPGVTLWAVRVCNNGGICLTSNMIAGIEWVVEQKTSGAIDFAVANMSLGTSDDAQACGPSTTSSLHQAVCGLVNEGVVLALAAGNSGVVKNAYPEAFTVAAIADFDGQGGGAGGTTCRADVDDTLADFSNFGSTVDIAAPGVCILSTSSGGGYVLGSGTSMAAPHVAGAVALYLHANRLSPASNGPGVQAIETAIRDAAFPEGTANDACSYDNERGSQEPLLFVNDALAFGGTGECDTATTVPVTDIAVTAVSAPGSAGQGDIVDVGVTVKNVGTVDVTSDILVTLTDTPPTGGTAGTVTDSPQIISRGLVAGAQTTLTFHWDTSGASTGDHTLTAGHDFADKDLINNSKSSIVTITEPGTEVTVSSITPDTMQVDNSIDVIISGARFQAGAEVSFENGTGPAPAASSVVVVDDTTITATITAKSAGPPRNRVWDVRVSNPDGSAGVLVDGFTVTP